MIFEAFCCDRVDHKHCANSPLDYVTLFGKWRWMNTESKPEADTSASQQHTAQSKS